jgi:hypothetical protein
MKVRQIGCERALMTLIGVAGDDAREEVVAARLHAARCPRCSAAYDSADPGGQLVDPYARRRTRPASALRVGLLGISVAQLALAIPWLVGKSLLPDSHVAVSHLTRDGALGLVVAALGLVTVWRPRYVHGTRLIGLLVLGLQLVAGVADQQMSSVSADFEVVHFLVVIIVLGLFAVAADLARRSTPRFDASSRVLQPALETKRAPSR